MDSAQIKGQRLHRISPLFILFDNIKKLIFPALIAIFGTRGSSWELYALGGAALISVISIIQYRFYRYWIEDKQIRVKEGVLFRNLRQVDYDKIQNLNLTQGPLHRLLGVAKVQLESASGGKPEAVINVIDLQSVEEIKKRIHGEHFDDLTNDSNDQVSNEKHNPSILSLKFSEIVRYGIISNRGLVVVAIGLGFLSQFFDSDDPRSFGPMFKRGINYLGDSLVSVLPDTSLLANFLYGFMMLITALVLLWLLSIGMALFKFHGFTLVEKKGKLSASMGLLTRLQATIPLSRIQTLTIHNSWLHRLFKRIGVSVETAGGVNTEQQGITMKQIAPVLPANQRLEYLQQVQADVDWQQVDWTLIEQRAWRRVFKVSLIIWALVLLTTNIYSPWLYAFCLTLAAVWSFIFAKLYVKNTGYYLSEEMIAFKSGVIFRKETYLRLPKVQTARIKESLFDRRHKMATLELDTAGATVGAHHIEIPYLNLSNAEKIHGFVASRIKNIQFEW